MTSNKEGEEGSADGNKIEERERDEIVETEKIKMKEKETI